MNRLTNGINFWYVEKEIREELEEYKKQLLKSETRKNALCEYYHAMGIVAGLDIALQTLKKK